MIRPSENVIRAIKALEHNDFWAEIVSWIESSWLKQSVGNNSNTGEVTIKTQGRCLELEDILKHIKKVDEYRENAKDAKRMEKGG
jgi:hypothetical protein